MKLIEHIEVGSGGAASIDFTSISGDYTDLMIELTARCDNANRQDIFAQFNGVGTSTYSMRRLYGTGSATASDSVTNTSSGFRVGRSTSTADTANTFTSNTIYIPNYSVGGIAKTASSDSVEENNATSALQLIFASSWSGTDAITSIYLANLTGNFVQYSSATLFGVTAGSDGTTTVS
jgi:hypothetical protein